MKIAVIGNGPIDRRYISEIDAHDFVIRFNSAHHYGKRGNRIDVLVLTNTGTAARHLADDPMAINAAAISAAKEVWLARAPETISAATRSWPTDKSHWWTDHSSAIEQRVAPKACRFIDAATHADATHELARYGAPPFAMPSTGMLTLFHLQRTMWPCQATLYGFTHEGWCGHPWDAERALTNEWAWVEKRKSRPSLHYLRTKYLPPVKARLLAFRPIRYAASLRRKVPV